MKKLALAIIGLAVTLGLSYVGWLALVHTKTSMTGTIGTLVLVG